MKNKKITKVFYIFLIFFSVFGVVLIGDRLQYKARVNALDEAVYLANIRIVRSETEMLGATAITHYDQGSSGVIYNKIGNRYYVLTANHILEEPFDNVILKFYIQTPLDKSRNDAIADGDCESVYEYYQMLPEARIEAVDYKHDIAVISFVSQQDLTVLPIAKEFPLRREEVIVVSNPNGEKNVTTFGRIETLIQKTVEFDDFKTVEDAIRHNAEISFGSSGSALLNSNYEIIGINIGGSVIEFLRLKLSLLSTSYATPVQYLHSLVQTVNYEY